MICHIGVPVNTTEGAGVFGVALQSDFLFCSSRCTIHVSKVFRPSLQPPSPLHEIMVRCGTYFAGLPRYNVIETACLVP